MVGAQETQAVVSDRVDPARASALMATLGMDGPGFETGDALPPLFHQIYFWDPAQPDALAGDGHRIRGVSLPETAGAHRMWAGGRVTFHAPFCAGIAARRITSIKDITAKAGRSGPLTFVTRRHVVMQRGEAVVTEEEVILYRTDPLAPPDLPEVPRHVAEVRIGIGFPPTKLFRYSALTFNAHRIHYDTDYCRTQSGYPGLVVHGPLIAQYLALLAESRLGRLASFSTRAHSPLFGEEAATLCATGQDVWLEGPDGRMCQAAAAVAVS